MSASMSATFCPWRHAVPVVLVAAMLVLQGCTQDPVVMGTILQPSQPSYTEDATLVLEAEVTVDGQAADPARVSWNSDLAGTVGTGLRSTVNLAAGRHHLTLCWQEAGLEAIELDAVDITVTALEFTVGGSRTMGLSASPASLSLPAGSYAPLLCCFDGTAGAVRLELPQQALAGAVVRSGVSPDTGGRDLSARTFRMPAVNLPLPAARKTRRQVSRAVPGDQRDFLVADTTGQDTNGHTVRASLERQGDGINLWVDTAASLEQSVLDSFMSTLQDRAWPRVKAIWGTTWADLDEDGALAVLLTPRINDEAVAVGFFNPQDLYPQNSDTTSTAWNPVSNQMDIVYLAVPDDVSGVFAYTGASVLATFCHEAAHLIGFSLAYWLPSANGGTPDREELFLDEGMAHLTESLCGFGESGGNLAFFSVYLSKPWAYSLAGPDLDAATDSIGKRGFSAAFLSWLFWKQGGAAWDGPGHIADTGGIAFLRRLVNGGRTGLANLSNAAGADIRTLLTEWAAELDFQDQGVTAPVDQVIDPVSGEELTMSPFHGDIQIGSRVYALAGPVRTDLAAGINKLPWTLAWGTTFTLSDQGTMTAATGRPDASSLIRFDMLQAAVR